MTPRVTLLGPQRFMPTVGAVVQELGLAGPFALITAGWQVRETEDEELRAAIGGTAVNLGIYDEANAVYREDKELHLAIRARQTQLRELQELYRLRLDHAMDAAYRLVRITDKEEAILGPERESALEMVRSIDRHHLARVGELRAQHDARYRPLEREALARRREAIAQRIHDAEAVFIAGGHVAVLLNRLRLFDLAPILHHKPVIAWSAGAMAVSDRVVLFHDAPPQGRGHAEVLDRGLALCNGVLPLPHASQRLALDDATRVGLFARRFFDLRSVALDPEVRIDWVPPRWLPGAGVRQLTRNGIAAWSADEEASQ